MSESYSLWGALDRELQERDRTGLLRHVATWSPISARLIQSPDGRKLVHFGSNDYLSLSWHPMVLRAAAASHFERYGAGASPLLSGHTRAHETLRRQIAELENTKQAALFSSGFAANVGVVSALAGKGDLIFSDRLNHASLIDGCRLSRATTHVFPHGNMEALRQLVSQHRGAGRRAFVVTDSVFSMDGDLAPVRDFEQLAEQYDLGLIVDEAHATGVYGERGAGLLEECRCVSDRWIKVGTLSKAIGCSGGFVAGPRCLIDYLENVARSFIYSTSMTIGNCLAAAASVELLSGMVLERRTLRKTSVALRERLQKIGHRVGAGDSPIVPVYCPSVEEVLAWSRRLLELGFYVPAIRPPTVPANGCLLRVSLNTSHTDADLDGLVEACRF
ncbi:aminotransferase class I/II-fold pyridoxal phosphate-dependent enzyme [Pirellulaceae bacterium SH501]